MLRQRGGSWDFSGFGRDIRLKVIEPGGACRPGSLAKGYSLFPRRHGGHWRLEKSVGRSFRLQKCRDRKSSMPYSAGTFQAFTDTEVLVLGSDGNLWMEHAGSNHQA